MIFFVFEVFRPNVKSTHLPIPLISQLSSPSLSHLGIRLTIHSPPTDKVKNEWSCISAPHTPSCCAKGNFTSLLLYPFLCMRMKLEFQVLIRAKTVKGLQWTADWFCFDCSLCIDTLLLLLLLLLYHGALALSATMPNCT